MKEIYEKDIALPVRKPDTHKGDYGKCLIAAGSVGYTGAASMAAHAAVRAGAGLVFLGVPEPIYAIEAVKNDEVIVFPLPSEDGRLGKGAADELRARLETCDTALIGPGLGRSEGVTETVLALLRSSRAPLVLDADGINAVSEHIHVLYEAPCPLILTPHEGEFARLGGDIRALGRAAAAERFAREYGCILVLKGHRTITAFPDGELFLNTTGNAGMAKGGSGDVLAGVLAALLGQGLPLKKAVPYAVWLHGRAGDLAAAKFGEYSMTPCDMIGFLGEAMKPLIRWREN